MSLINAGGSSVNRLVIPWARGSVFELLQRDKKKMREIVCNSQGPLDAKCDFLGLMSFCDCL